MSSLLHLFAQPEPPHRLIAPCPRIRAGRVLKMIWSGLIIFYFLLICMLMLMELLITPRAVQFPWIMLLLMLMNLPNILFGFVQERYWKHIEPWRFVASLGNTRLLANGQPEPRVAALPFPTTIKIRPIIERRLLIGFLSFPIFCLAAVSFFACIMLFPSLSLWPWALLIAVLIGGLFSLGTFFLLQIRYPMEIIEEGIRVRSVPGGFPTLIFWHEMRLFACYPEPGARNGDEAMVYELSSASQVIYWTWMRKKNLLNTIMGPSMPIEEHNLQMQALCSLISTKTGLPLYDLSKGLALRLEETAEAR